jgi:hypothetical protein
MVAFLAVIPLVACNMIGPQRTQLCMSQCAILVQLILLQYSILRAVKLRKLPTGMRLQLK